jgi:hypothetical protein
MTKPAEKKFKSQDRTSLAGHKREGKLLKPPFVQFGVGKGLVSWMNDRLPEMVWAALLIAALGRSAALCSFREFLRFIAERPDRELFWDGTLTGFANLDLDKRNDLIGVLCGSEETRQALAPLLWFDGLPARVAWQQMLQNHKSDRAEILLMEAVRMTLFHQTQEATDCRWVRLMCGVFGRRIVMRSEELLQLNGYPKFGDQRTVRPSIRAAEGMMDCGQERDPTWSRAFWLECWEKTPCMTRVPLESDHDPDDGRSTVIAPLSDIRRQLERHWENTHPTTAVEAKHDAVFGMTFYAVRVMEEALSLADGRTVLGRLAIRILLEIRITLRHLLEENKPELWRSWRAYGVGQAKLSSLKLDQLPGSPPHYLDADNLTKIANEDLWEELVAVDLGHWTRADLRKLSEKVGLKDLYDRYYGWTSAYGHAHWGAVRESIYATCLNPLHRGHRFPVCEKPPPLPAVKEDLRVLLNAILSELDSAYPAFDSRIGNSA